MAYKEVFRVEISEVIRRWRAGDSQRHIASGMGLSRDTVAKYITAAEGLGLSLEGPDPSEGAAQPSGGDGIAGAAAGGGAQAGHAGALGRPDPPVAHRRSVAADPHPRVAGRAGLPGVVYLPVALRGPSQLAEADKGHGADGGYPAGRGGRDGLRPPGADS